jgi:hypothetical protein
MPQVFLCVYLCLRSFSVSIYASGLPLCLSIASSYLLLLLLQVDFQLEVEKMRADVC